MKEDDESTVPHELGHGGAGKVIINLVKNIMRCIIFRERIITDPTMLDWERAEKKLQREQLK